MITRKAQYFMTLEQFEQSIIQGLVKNNTDYQTIVTALNSLIAQVQAALPAVTLHFAAIAYNDGTGQLVMQLEVGHALSSRVMHWDAAILMNAYLESGTIYASLPLTTKLYTPNASPISSDVTGLAPQSN
jgi:hypothetical protein